MKQEMQELEEDSSIFINIVELLPASVNIPISNKCDTLESEDETKIDDSFLKEKQKAMEEDIKDLYVEETARFKLAMATTLPPANFESIEECHSFKGKYDILEYFDYDTNKPSEDKIRQSLMTKTVGSLDCGKL